MGPAFRNAVVRDHDDLVGLADGAEAVGDHDGGAAAGQLFERSLNVPFTVIIQCRSCFVENQNRRILQKYPRN